MDRVTIETLLRGAAVFSGVAALLLVSAIAVDHTLSGNLRGDIAAISESSPRLLSGPQ
jgi:hypothetical protein